MRHKPTELDHEKEEPQPPERPDQRRETESEEAARLRKHRWEQTRPGPKR